jgi:hypothetical protein
MARWAELVSVDLESVEQLQALAQQVEQGPAEPGSAGM